MAGLQRLISRESSKSSGYGPIRGSKRINLKSRHPRLHELAGEYTTNYLDIDEMRGRCYEIDHGMFDTLVDIYGDGCRVGLSLLTDDTLRLIAQNKSPNGRRLGKLLNQRGCSEEEIQQLMKVFRSNAEVKFELSCRYKDLLRMADTKHYASCLAQWRGIQKLRYLANPDVAIVFIRDSKGDFVARCLVRLLKTESGELVLGLNRMYGNGLSHEQIAHALRNRIKVYDLGSIKYYGGFDAKVPLTPVSKNFTGISNKFVWEDSPHKVVGDSVLFHGKLVEVK